jgi:SAM-dependent methyltransferase
LTQQDVRLSEWRWQEQYSTDERLRARIETHERYSELREPWPDWVANQLPQPLAGPLLDAGAGNGAIFLAVAPRLQSGGRAVAFDLSPGMLAACRARAADAGLAATAFVNGTIEALPFADDTFGLAMANHMLYHVPDIPRAVAELRRVLRPGGLFVATTGSRDDYAEMLALHSEGVRAVGLPLDPGQDDSVITRFNLENGRDYIAPYFPEVELRKRETPCSSRPSRRSCASISPPGFTPAPAAPPTPACRPAAGTPWPNGWRRAPVPSSLAKGSSAWARRRARSSRGNRAGRLPLSCAVVMLNGVKHRVLSPTETWLFAALRVTSLWRSESE